MKIDFMPETVLSLLDQNIFVKDENGDYLFCNNASASLLGTTPDTMIGKNDHDYFPEAIAEKNHRASQRTLNGS